MELMPDLFLTGLEELHIIFSGIFWTNMINHKTGKNKTLTKIESIVYVNVSNQIFNNPYIEDQVLEVISHIAYYQVEKIIMLYASELNMWRKA